MAPKRITREFASLDAIIAHAEGEPKSAGRLGRVSRESSRSRDTFTLTSSFDEAATLAREGWTEIRPDIDRIVADIRDSVMSTVQRRVTRRRSVAGGTVNVSRMLSGEPRCMTQVKVRETPKVGRVVRILIGGNCAAMVDGPRIQKRGAAIVSLIEAIHLSGCSTEITVGVLNIKGGIRHEMLVRIKDAETRLDVNSMMFAIAHPSMLRRIAWGAAEREDDSVRRAVGFYNGGSYGHVDYYADEDTSEYDVLIDVPNSYAYAATNMEAAPVEWIKGTLTGLGLFDAGRA
jgi:hypothetical protein